MLVRESRPGRLHRLIDGARTVAARLDPLMFYIPHRIYLRRRLGYWPRLSSPRSFNEKILRRKRIDRSPLLPLVTDKLGVRRFLADALGREAAADLTVPVYHVTSVAGDLPFDRLPEEYVVKPAHLSGDVVIVTRESPADRRRLFRLMRRWLATRHGGWDHQWAYQALAPSVMVEKRLKGGNGLVPEDYKFFVFHGRVRLIQVDLDRFEGHRRVLMSPDWRPLEVAYLKPRGQAPARPATLSRMREIAEAVGRRFDFIRIDFYAEEDSVYIGELTVYPESGRGRFEPVAFDFRLGTYW